MIKHSTSWMAGLGSVAITLLAACGGGDDSGQALAPTALPVPLSLTAQPDLHNPAATPADGVARTASGRYLSGRQAEDLDAALRGDVVWVMVPCCGPDQRDLAILTAYGMQAAQNLGNDAPFLVRGRNLREAALVADSLTRAGLRRVVLVTS